MALKTKIKYLRVTNNLTQEELANKINCSKRTVGAWEQGSRSPNQRQRKKLCEIFNISEAELFGSTSPQTSNYPIQKIPIISWIHANQFKDIEDNSPVGLSDEYVYTIAMGKDMFALRVDSDCMEPEFREGDIIIINPHLNIEHNDYIIVANRSSNTATFKQYKQYGDKIILHPLNPRYSDIELDHKVQYTIIGKVIEKIKKY